MTSLARRCVPVLVATVAAAALVAGPILPPPQATASTVTAAVFTGGGAGTALVGGTLYARNGASVTLVVFTTAARCVELSGALERRLTAGVATTTWSFPFLAGVGNGPRVVTMTAWSATSDGACAGTVGEARSVSYVLDNEGPIVTAVANPESNSSGWQRDDVALAWSATDAGSGVASGPTPSTAAQTSETGGTDHAATATDRVGNVGTGALTVRLDRTAPTIAASHDPAPNGAGWNRSDVTVTFACDDALSGVAACPDPATVDHDTDGTTVDGRAADVAGNSSEPAAVVVRIDRERPVVELVGGPLDGAFYEATSLPPAPDCRASDARSGIDGSCVVEGYGTGPGRHTVRATARDRAGNTDTASATYTVTAWTLRGFRQPVAMDGVLNVVKGGATVPLKFEVFDGETELASTDVVAGVGIRDVACQDGAMAAIGIEPVVVDATGVRYDDADGQFVLTWKTPRTAGACYEVSVRTTDGSRLVAAFRTR
jgi:hypothetical protein